MEIKQYGKRVAPTGEVGMNFASASDRASMRRVVPNVTDKRFDILADVTHNIVETSYKVEVGRQSKASELAFKTDMDNLLLEQQTDPKWSNMEYETYLKEHEKRVDSIRKNAEKNITLHEVSESFRNMADMYSNDATIKSTFLGRKYLADRSDALRLDLNTKDVDKAVYGDVTAYNNIVSRIEADVASGVLSKENAEKELISNQHDVGVGFAKKTMRDQVAGSGVNAYDVLLNDRTGLFSNLDQPTKEALLTEAFNLNERISSAKTEAWYVEEFKYKRDKDDLLTVMSERGQTSFTRLDGNGNEVLVDGSSVITRGRELYGKKGLAEAMSVRDEMVNANRTFSVMSKLYSENIGNNEVLLDTLSAQSGSSDEALKLFNEYQNAYDEKKEKLNTDAAGYYIEGFTKMYGKMPSLEQIVSFQERNNVPKEKQGVISKNLAINEANLIKSLSAENAAGYLLQKKQETGDMFSLYARDLTRHGNIDNSLRFAMAQDDPNMMVSVIKNGRMKDDELKTSIPDYSDASKEINIVLSDALVDFKSAFFKGGRMEEKVGEFDRIVGAVRKQALALLATGQEEDPSAAAEIASQLVLKGNRFKNINNETFIIPEYVGKTRINDKAVTKSLKHIISDSGKRGIVKSGYFVNNSAGDGVILYWNNQAVTDENGKVREFKFKDLNKTYNYRVAELKKEASMLKERLKKYPNEPYTADKLKSIEANIDRLNRGN